MAVFKAGPVWVRSEVDSRWNFEMNITTPLMQAGLPLELTRELDKKKEKYGEPPADLHWSGMQREK